MIIRIICSESGLSGEDFTGKRLRSGIVPDDYAYSSICFGAISGSSWPTPGRWRGWPGGLSSRGFRCGRRWLRVVGDGVGVSGLMLSNVSISVHLNLLFLVIYIGSHGNILGRMPGRAGQQVWIWLFQGLLCENRPEITCPY